MEVTFTGRTAVVTGSAGGIGSGIVTALVTAGADVVGMDVASQDHVAAACAAGPGRFRPVTVDVTDAQQVADAVPAAVDTVIAAAGAFPNRPFIAWDTEAFRRLWTLNVEGVFNLLQATVPTLTAAGRGRVVLVSSQAVFAGVPGFAPYAATKAALIGMARSLSAELAPDGVLVNVVTPGLTETTAAVGGDVGPFFDHVVAAQDIPRRMQVDDLVGAVLFLCDDASRFMTGQIINVDGGATKR